MTQRSQSPRGATPALCLRHSLSTRPLWGETPPGGGPAGVYAVEWSPAFETSLPQLAYGLMSFIITQRW